MRGQIFENRRVQATGGRPVISAEPSIPSWVVTTLIGAGGFAIAMTAMFIFFDPAGNAPREDPAKSAQAQYLRKLANIDQPPTAEDAAAKKQLVDLDRRARKSGERNLSLPCNEEFRQAFIKDARAYLAASSNTGSFGVAVGRMSSMQFDKPDDAQEAIDNALNARHVSRGELSADGSSGISLGLLLNPQYQPVVDPLASGVPLGRAATGEAAGRYTPLCMAGRR